MILKIITFTLVLATQYMMPFTERELEIIYNGDENTPFRILQTTDHVDSLLLRMPSGDVPLDSIVNNESLQLLIKRLRITMQEAGGVGIAAPQIGVLKNIFLFTRVNDPENPVCVAINPRIVNYPDGKVCFERDGCLSIPDIRANTLRFPWIDVEYRDEKGNYHRERLEGYSRTDNFVAVIFQHEYDHLQGVLFTDKMCPAEESFIDRTIVPEH